MDLPWKAFLNETTLIFALACGDDEEGGEGGDDDGVSSEGCGSENPEAPPGDSDDGVGDDVMSFDDEYLRANLMAASLASVPELQRKTLYIISLGVGESPLPHKYREEDATDDVDDGGRSISIDSRVAKGPAYLL